MLSPLIAVLILMFAETPVAAAPAAATPAATATPAAPVNPVTAEINALLEPYRGKSGDRLRGKLGLSSGTRKASDGEVVFWMINVQQEMSCGMEIRKIAPKKAPCTDPSPPITIISSRSMDCRMLN